MKNRSMLFLTGCVLGFIMSITGCSIDRRDQKVEYIGKMAKAIGKTERALRITQSLFDQYKEVQHSLPTDVALRDDSLYQSAIDHFKTANTTTQDVYALLKSDRFSPKLADSLLDIHSHEIDSIISINGALAQELHKFSRRDF